MRISQKNTLNGSSACIPKSKLIKISPVKILSSVILSLMLLVLWSCSDVGKDPLSPGDETNSSLIDYLTEIQPIFNSRCADCHINGNSGDLNLSSWSSLRAGDSRNGPVITVGDSTNSLLWIKVNSGSMPLSGSDLTDAQIHLIAQWIFEGALEEPPNN